MCLIGVHLTGMCLMGVYLINVHLTGAHLMGMHITGVHRVCYTVAQGAYKLNYSFTVRVGASYTVASEVLVA